MALLCDRQGIQGGLLGPAGISGLIRDALAKGEVPLKSGLQKVRGEVLVNHRVASEGQLIKPGDTIVTAGYRVDKGLFALKVTVKERDESVLTNAWARVAGERDADAGHVDARPHVARGRRNRAHHVPRPLGARRSRAARQVELAVGVVEGGWRGRLDGVALAHEVGRRGLGRGLARLPLPQDARGDAAGHHEGRDLAGDLAPGGDHRALADHRPAALRVTPAASRDHLPGPGAWLSLLLARL